MDNLPPRRVVTGLSGDGRSTVLIDGAAPNVIWAAPDIPADNQGGEDRGHSQFGFPDAGTNFVWVEIPPGGGTEMHATNTLDHLIVILGEAVLVTETGETVLHAGDVLVDRGVVHAWRNDGDITCRIVGTLIAARPLGLNG